jgi:primosomal protein N'
MKLIDVLLVAPNTSGERLTYYSSLPLERGALVLVPVQKKNLPAVVLESHSVSNAKILLKSAGFKLKRVTRILQSAGVSQSLLAAADDSADYFASTTGAVLSTIVPAKHFDKITQSTLKTETKAFRPKEILQAPDIDRYHEYRSLVRWVGRA